jgi:uncharacterized repeat protein (TIGR03803 family)
MHGVTIPRPVHVKSRTYIGKEITVDRCRRGELLLCIGANGSGCDDMGGTFYGTTQNGGTYGRGTVFALTPGTK